MMIYRYYYNYNYIDVSELKSEQQQEIMNHSSQLVILNVSISLLNTSVTNMKSQLRLDSKKIADLEKTANQLDATQVFIIIVYISCLKCKLLSVNL